jgi:hypothetical protein
MKRKATSVQPKDVALIFAVTGALLSIPLIAMQFTDEVAWTLFDFVVMGMLLSGTGSLIVLASRKIRTKPTAPQPLPRSWRTAHFLDTSGGRYRRSAVRRIVKLTLSINRGTPGRCSKKMRRCGRQTPGHNADRRIVPLPVS